MDYYHRNSNSQRYFNSFDKFELVSKFFYRLEISTNVGCVGLCCVTTIIIIVFRKDKGITVGKKGFTNRK